MKLEIGAVEKELACPSCGFEYGLHIAKVICYGGTGDDYRSEGKIEITDPMTVRFDHHGFATDNRCRELSAWLEVWCENCHNANRIQFGFHKGSVRVKSEFVAKRTMEPPKTLEDSPTT